MTKENDIITETVVRSRISGLRIQISLWEGTPQSCCSGLLEQEIAGFDLRHFEMLEDKPFQWLQESSDTFSNSCSGCQGMKEWS